MACSWALGHRRLTGAGAGFALGAGACVVSGASATGSSALGSDFSSTGALAAGVSATGLASSPPPIACEMPPITKTAASAIAHHLL